jgi:hypothetical protein
MTDKAERRKFLKAALAALATTAGATSCRHTEPVAAMCYVTIVPYNPTEPEPVADPENPTPHDGEEEK